MFRELIDLAAEFGKIVKIGRIRGSVGSRPREEVERLFIDMVRDLCSYAAALSVMLVLESVNRYELDFVNSIPDGVRLLNQVGADNLKLMPDLCHMNIEDVEMAGELAKCRTTLATATLQTRIGSPQGRDT